jgi:hypothetical protein
VPGQLCGQGEQKQDAAAAAAALHGEYNPIAELLALQGLQVGVVTYRTALLQ